MQAVFISEWFFIVQIQVVATQLLLKATSVDGDSVAGKFFLLPALFLYHNLRIYKSLQTDRYHLNDIYGRKFHYVVRQPRQLNAYYHVLPEPYYVAFQWLIFGHYTVFLNMSNSGEH